MSVPAKDKRPEPPAAQPTSAAEAALAYAARGWHVFPIWWAINGRCACDHDECKPAKHPIGRLVPHGHLDATTDPRLIRRWWTAAPLANIGIACGRVSRLVVIDADGADGRNALAALLEEQDDDGSPAVSESGGGGLHLVYELPVGAHAKSSVGVVAYKTDVRGDGASFVAPPSVHISGRTYRWDVEPPTPGPAPTWLLRLIAPPPAPASTSGPSDGTPIPEGQRNATLTSLAGQLRRAGLSAEAIAAVLTIENAKRCRLPLPEREVLAIARSIGRYAPGPVTATARSRLVVIRNGVEVAS